MGLRVVLAAALLALLPSTASARDVVVESFDGTPIVGHFFPAQEGAKGPTVLSGHGWGGTGSTDPDSKSSPAGSVGHAALRKAGYNVLTWDARGFGGSGGVVQVDSPEAEARDVQALISWVATQPEALLDGPGDPRIGMVGGSYGGGIQLVTAGIGERRLDVLVPDIAWNSLVSSLYKDETLKGGWGSLLTGAGLPTATLLGLGSPAGPQTGGLDPHIPSAYIEGSTTGVLSPENLEWFRSRGPGKLVENIRIPTLLTQGTVDTLFTLDEAATNYRILRGNGVPVKMMWHCGGHGTCTTPGGNGESPVERRVLQWLERYLDRDATVDTGPRFEWVADDGKWRSAPDFPLRRTGSLTSEGSGTLTVTPGGVQSGDPLAARRSGDAFELALPAPTGAAQIVGAPRLTLTYSGSGQARVIYAQVVDDVTDLVLGNQVVPIPVTLDGAEHTVERPLEMIAASATPGSRYVLQLAPSSQVYLAQQRGAASLDIKKATIELPIVDPSAAAGSAPAVTTTVKVRFRRHARGTRRLLAVVTSNRTLRNVRVTLRDSRRRVVGSGRAARVAKRRTVALKLRSKLRRGRYTVEVRWAGGALRTRVRL